MKNNVENKTKFKISAILILISICFIIPLIHAFQVQDQVMYCRGINSTITIAGTLNFDNYNCTDTSWAFQNVQCNYNPTIKYNFSINSQNSVYNDSDVAYTLMNCPRTAYGGNPSTGGTPGNVSLNNTNISTAPKINQTIEDKIANKVQDIIENISGKKVTVAMAVVIIAIVLMFIGLFIDRRRRR